MGDSKEILIIGGGVIGLACAHYLMDQGARVRILEKQRVGSGASHGNCGLLYFSDVIPLSSPGAVSHEIFRTLMGTSPLYIKPRMDLGLFIWLMRFAAKCTPGHMARAAQDKSAILEYSSALFSDLFTLIPPVCDFEKQGILTLFKKKKNLEGFRKTNAFLERFNPGYQFLSRNQALELEPALSKDIAGAWYSSMDHHLRPERFLAAWKDHLVQRGLALEENCQVLDFSLKGRTIRSVRTEKGEFSARAVVLAAGVWSPGLGDRLGIDLPVQPGKGYSITMARPRVCPRIPCMLYEKNVVVTPWKSGYRLGGTMEFSGFSHDLNLHRLKKLVDGAKTYMKSPVGRPLIEAWTGLRPMTFDDMPIIGRSEGHDNLVIATGHGMLGLTLATGTGKLVADLVLERKPEINPAPYSPERL